jgi:tyrocidine synthetase-3
LTGRSVFPTRDEWSQWEETHEESDPVSLKIKKLQKLEEMGGKVIYLKADAASPREMRDAVTRGEKIFGEINGVIHSAGIIEGRSMRTIQELSRENCQQQFQAKVYGLLVLAEFFKDKEPDFCWVLSSISCVLGGLGFGAYASANSFMDVMVRKQNQAFPGQRCHWLSLNWDGMDEKESADAFERLFSLERIDQLVFSRGGKLQERIDRWIKLESVKDQDQSKKKKKSSFHPRPELSTAYTAPTGPIENTIANIWQDILGFDEIGSRDDFLELGGDSLRSITVISRIQKELSVAIPLVEFFSRPTIKQLAQYITGAEKSTYSSIEPTEKKEYYALSSAQKRLYILQQIEKDTTGYNQSHVLLLEGNVDRRRLNNTFTQLIRRHETLRTSIRMMEDEPVQRICRDIPFAMEECQLSKNERDEWVGGFIRPFDLGAAPFLRVGLARISDLKYLLIIDMHHIVTDGISHQLLVKESLALYEEQQLPRLIVQYKDYAQWQNSKKQKEAMKNQESYWLDVFSGEIPVLDLPADHERPPMQRFEGNTMSFSLDSHETGFLRKLAREENATMYMVLLSIYNVFLAKLSGQEDIIVGTPVAGRSKQELQLIMGVFINTLAMRNYPYGQKTFKEFLKEVRDSTLTSFENHDYQFEDLIERVLVKRDMSRNPLFDTFFVLQNMELLSDRIPEVGLSDFKLIPYERPVRTSKFDLLLDCVESPRQINFVMEYSTNLFKTETIERFVSYFKRVVSAIGQDIHKKLADVELVDEQERKQLLLAFNDTAADYSKTETIVELFSQQVEKIPDRISVVGPAQSSKFTVSGREQPVSHPPHSAVTYGELDRRSRRLACLIRETVTAPDAIVGIMMERSVEMMIGILGIVKAGCAYLPIDPQYPGTRINCILKDSGASLVLTQAAFTGKTPGAGVIRLEDEKLYEEPETGNLEKVHTPGSLAYVLYTSGSTGTPKGVAIEHYSLVNRLNWMQKKYPLRRDDVILHKTPFTFDVSVWEIFWWGMQGARVCVLTPGSEKDPQQMVEAIYKNHVTVMHFVPSMLSVFLEYTTGIPDVKRLASLRQVIASGEALGLSLVERFNFLLHKENGIALANLYGPTEATIDVSFYDCSPQVNDIVPIGKPIDNIKLLVIGKDAQLQPIGLVGELCIAGDGLARGYINNPNLTAKKFNRDFNQKLLRGSRGRFSRKEPPGHRRQTLYKTGDLACWRPDGNIQYLGRIDHQVKVRGNRIELGEIENRLAAHPGITEAVVLAVPAGPGGSGVSREETHLSAYITTSRELTVQGLREYLAAQLPHYMIPTYFFPLEKMPLTPNGKADRKALAALNPLNHHKNLNTGVEYVEPATQKEKIIADTWKEVLGLDKIGIYDNFFELGGTSLNLIRINTKLQKALEKDIPVVVMFQYPTVASLCEYIVGEKREDRLARKAREEVQLNRVEESMQETIQLFEEI